MHTVHNRDTSCFKFPDPTPWIERKFQYSPLWASGINLSGFKYKYKLPEKYMISNSNQK